MFVKICGITSEEDALLAVAMGADAVGFVFAPSTRQMQPVQAYDIVRRLPPDVLTVGVFRDELPQRVVDIVHQVGLKAAQLHGHESIADTAFVRSRVGTVIKAFAAGEHHSAVERSPGRKDPRKVKDFIERARAAAPLPYEGADRVPYDWQEDDF